SPPRWPSTSRAITAARRAARLAAEVAVDITSHHGGETRCARNFRVVPYDVPRGCAAAYFPEANVLVPHDHVAAGSNTPASKAIVVTVRRAESAVRS
ncbi:MAG TPA: hypothetical protein VJO33_09895, partial [Gemmatimonadaceae bacterium]|nr:hypothetical protein [Gemmatimonadaceae bacterium]